MRTALVLLAATMAGSPLAAQGGGHRDCGVQSGARLENAGVGAIRIGATLDQLESQCEVVRDTVVYPDDTHAEHVIGFKVDKDMIEVIADSGNRVTEIRVTSYRWKTVEGLGVDTELAKFLEIPGLLGIPGSEQELAVFLQVPQYCGLDFRLPWYGASANPPDSVTVQFLKTLPPKSTVTSVIVHACVPKPGS
jgi:hypothetical protein